MHVLELRVLISGRQTGNTVGHHLLLLLLLFLDKFNFLYYFLNPKHFTVHVEDLYEYFCLFCQVVEPSPDIGLVLLELNRLTAAYVDQLLTIINLFLDLA